MTDFHIINRFGTLVRACSHADLALKYVTAMGEDDFRIRRIETPEGYDLDGDLSRLDFEQSYYGSI